MIKTRLGRGASVFDGSGWSRTAIASTQEGLPLSLQTCFGADPID